MAERGRPAIDVSGRDGRNAFFIGWGTVPTSSFGGRKKRGGQGASRSTVLSSDEYPLVSLRTAVESVSTNRLLTMLSPLVFAARTPTRERPNRVQSIRYFGPL